MLKFKILLYTLLLMESAVYAQNLPGFLFENRFNRPQVVPFIQQHESEIFLSKGNIEDSLVLNGETFSFKEGKNLVHTWGRGAELPGKYFRDNLPSFFIRQLHFNSFEFEIGLFEWLLTGDDGAINIAISRDSIWIYQRYYNSYGFNDVKGDEILLNRHPERVWLLHGIAYHGEIENISLDLSHKMLLSLHINGVKVSEQACYLDITEHQLRFSGTGANIAGDLMMATLGKAEIMIDYQKRQQKMLGWGGIATPTAYHLLSPKGKEMWWDYLQEYNLLIHREYPNGQNLKSDYSNWDNLDDAMPHYYGDNFPNSEISDFEYIKKVQELGGMSVFEFWRFPTFVQVNGKSLDIDAYIDAMITYCKTATERTGQPPAIVGIQNEMGQKEENWHKMTLALRKALDKNGFEEVQIHQQDMSQVGKGLLSAKAFTADEDVWNTLDYSAVHMYDYQEHLHDPDAFDSLMWAYKKIIGNKPFISTELCANRPLVQTGSYRNAFAMAQLYHKNLTILDASSIMYCWIILNTVQPSYEASRSLFGVDKSNGFVPYPSSYQLRIFGAWSRRVMKDMHRVEATSSNPDVLVTAFDGKEGQSVVMVNRSNAKQVCTVNAKADFTFLERTSQYFQNLVESSPETKNGVIELELEPGEIVTLSNVTLYSNR